MSEQDIDVNEIPYIDPKLSKPSRKRKLQSTGVTIDLSEPPAKRMKKAPRAKKIKITEEQKEVKHKIIGTKKEVYNGLADHTKGGLKKNDFIQNKRGKIVSKKKAQQGAIAFEKYLKPALMKICEQK